jgi:hypothetical protein
LTAVAGHAHLHRAIDPNRIEMRQPAWYLLIWAAVVASLIATLLGFAARGRLGERSPGRAAVLGFLLGILVWAPIYGFAFEWLGSANAIGGALLGALHGGIAALIAFLRERRAHGSPAHRLVSVQGRRIITRTVYGAILGFLYVVP